MGIGWLWRFKQATHASAVRWKERRRGRIGARELARLPDYLLDDIGLRRDRSGVTVTISRAPNHTLGYLPADRVVTFDPMPRIDARDDQPATRSRQRAA